MRENTVIVYTDGACSGNPGLGGWAAIITGLPTGEVVLSGGEKQTTNNRMELIAAIASLQHLSHQVSRYQIIIYTDSQYVKNGMTAWIENWKRNGWKTAKKDPVKNVDLWQQLDQLNAMLKPQWRWVKGHDGHEYNERCDQLAVQAYQQFKEE